MKKGGSITESILTSIKYLLGGIVKEYEVFDGPITLHINSVFSVLTQLGIGPTEGFLITGPNELWTDYIPQDNKTLELVKSYMYLKVKLMFDPPSSSALLDSINKQISEYEWRLTEIGESNKTSA